ncbi:FAD-binding protein [Peptoniphilaceae bacterium SGI.137]
MKKKAVLILLSSLLVLSACSNGKNKTDKPAASESKQEVHENIKDGTYQGKAPSYNGVTEAEIVVKDKKLAEIHLLHTDDTESITSRAFPIVEKRILEGQTPNVDHVTSATYSSEGYMKAIGKAMKKAGFDIEKKYTPQDVKMEDTTAQLVVVGSGPSGMIAAIEAKEQGVNNIILIEKEDILGGNGKFDEFFFDFPNTQAQKDAGIEDNKEEYAELVRSSSFEDKAFVDKRIDEAWNFDAWLRKHGIEANYVENKRDTAHSSSELIGPYLISKLEGLLHELNIDVRPANKMVDLKIENNVAKAVTVEHNGQKYNITADRILIATGGFSSNPDLVSKYIPEATGLISSNTIGQTGDFINIALDNNIQLGHMNERILFNRVIPGTRYQLEARTPGSLIVNKNGERFFNEEDTYSVEFVNKVLEQEGKKAYYIYDDEKLHEREGGMGMGEYNKSSSLKELTEKLGLNYDNVVKSIEHLNAVSRGEETDPLGNNDIGDKVISLDSKFYYGTPIVPSIHMTLGGLIVDPQMRVLNNDGQAVENLYAAGEVTATSGIFLEAHVMGRLAGEEIAKSLAAK